MARLERDEITAMNEVIAAYQAKNPNVKFDVLYVPFDDLRGKFETAAATGRGPTVLIVPADWGPALYDSELVADISAMTSEGFLRTINPAAPGAVKYKDKLIGLPETIKGVIMFRNKALWKDAPKTVNDIITGSRLVTAGDIVGADLERGFFFCAVHLNGVGGQLMDAQGNPMFNDAKGVEWLNLLKSFSEAGPTEYNTDNDVNLIKAGKVAIVIDGTWNTTGLADAIGADNLVIDPWPTYGDGHRSATCGPRRSTCAPMLWTKARRPPGRSSSSSSHPTRRHAGQGGAHPGGGQRQDHRPGYAPVAGGVQAGHRLPCHPPNGILLGADGHRPQVGL